MEREVGSKMKWAISTLKVREKILERKLKSCHKCRDYKEQLQVTRWLLLKANLVLISKEGGKKC